MTMKSEILKLKRLTGSDASDSTCQSEVADASIHTGKCRFRAKCMISIRKHAYSGVDCMISVIFSWRGAMEVVCPL